MSDHIAQPQNVKQKLYNTESGRLAKVKLSSRHRIIASLVEGGSAALGIGRVCV